MFSLFKIEQCGIRKTLYILNKRIVSWLDYNTDVYSYVKSQGAKLGKNVCFITLPHSKYPTSWPIFASEAFLVSIGDNTIVSFNCTFITHDGSIDLLRKNYDPQIANSVFTIGEIKIGNNCFIGCNTTILPNVTIGDNSIIGAGSVVTKNIPSGEVWAGCPARFIRKTSDLADKYLEQNKTPEMNQLKEKYKGEVHWIMTPKGKIKF